jgi:hypothetical protein
MPGPTPITSPFQVRMLYTIDGLQHHCNFYCDLTLSGDVTGYDTVPNLAFSSVGVSEAIDGFFTLLAPFYDDADTTFDGATIWERVDNTYEYRSSGTTSVAGTATGAYEKANGLCVAGRDIKNQFLPTYIYEGRFGVAFKGNSPGSLGSSVRALAGGIYDIDNDATDDEPFAWSHSRDQWRRKRWLSVVVDTNEKLRRIRGLK